MNRSKKHECVLVISDLHIPYHHPQSFDFLKAIKKKYKDIDLVVNIGDELDQHGLSFHDTDPDLSSPGDELTISKKYIKELEKMYPEMILLHSNHSSLIYRRALKHGMPKAYLKSYNDFLDVGPGWEWVDDLNIKLSNGQECFMTHGISADGLKLAMQYGKHVVQDKYIQIQKSIMLPCTGLTVGTTYYVEQAGANHNGNSVSYNQTANSGSSLISGMNRHHVTMTHYKKN